MRSTMRALVLFGALALTQQATAQEVAHTVGIRCGADVCQLEVDGPPGPPVIATRKLIAALVKDGRFVGRAFELLAESETPAPDALLSGVPRSEYYLDTTGGATLYCVGIEYGCAMSADGQISPDTHELVKQLLSRANQSGFYVSSLHVDSPGGDVDSGIAIARIVHRAGIRVQTMKCASACSYIFLASRTGRFVGAYRPWQSEFEEKRSEEMSRVLIHSVRMTRPKNVSDEQYLSSMEYFLKAQRTLYREVGLPEEIADWAASIPSNEVRPLTEGQWARIGHYPAALRELLYARCGQLFDDANATLHAFRKTYVPGTPIGSKPEWRPWRDAVEMGHRCEDRIVGEIARKAQLGR